MDKTISKPIMAEVRPLHFFFILMELTDENMMGWDLVQ